MKLFIDYDFLHKWSLQNTEMRKRLYWALFKLSKYHNLSHASGMRPHFLMWEWMPVNIQDKLSLSFTKSQRLICSVVGTNSKDLKDISHVMVHDFGDYHGKLYKGKMVKKVL